MDETSIKAGRTEPGKMRRAGRAGTPQLAVLLE